MLVLEEERRKVRFELRWQELRASEAPEKGLSMHYCALEKASFQVSCWFTGVYDSSRIAR